MMIFDRHTTREEYHNFLISIFFQECKENEQPFFRGTHYISVKENLKKYVN